MSRPKAALVRLSELAPNQFGDFFVLLAARTKGVTRDGKPYYNCRFRDARRSAAFMVWSDGKWYKPCEHDWHEGQFYKVRGTFVDDERYGPQLEIENIRLATDADREHGFNPGDVIEHSRYDSEAMFADLKGLAEANLTDLPLRRLVLTLLDRHAAALKRFRRRRVGSILSQAASWSIPSR